MKGFILRSGRKNTHVMKCPAHGMREETKEDNEEEKE